MKMDGQHSMEQVIKGVVLILISSGIFCFTMTIIGLNLDFKYCISWIWFIMDDICLFLMFKENQLIYQNVFGCLCDKFCMKCISGSKYQKIHILDDDEVDGL